MNLSKHFTLEEMTQSQTASRAGIDNTPLNPVIVSLQYGCEKILEPIRAIGGNIIIVSSGYRCEALNALIGGSKSSQHCRGEAADINMVGKTPLELMKIIVASCIIYDQLIYEFGRWVHVSWKRYGVNRRMIMKAESVNGKTVYTLMKKDELL
jgi:zinc D-Ala-D-Ala carboxypeptidase